MPKVTWQSIFRLFGSKAHAFCGRDNDLCLVSFFLGIRKTAFSSLPSMRLSSGQCTGSKGHLCDFRPEAIKSLCSLFLFSLPFPLRLQGSCVLKMSVSQDRRALKSQFMKINKEILPMQMCM